MFGRFLNGVIAFSILINVVLLGPKETFLSFLPLVLVVFGHIVFHESGHAVAAIIVRDRLREISIGVGKPLLNVKVLGCRIKLRLLFLGGGHVKTISTSSRWFRARRTALYLAGWCGELVLSVSLFSQFGFDGVAQTSCVLSAVSVFTNLVPRSAGVGRNDGGRILDLWRLPADELERVASQDADAVDVSIEIEELAERGEFDRLVELTDQLTEEQLTDVDAKCAKSIGLVFAGRFPEGVGVARRARDQLLEMHPANRRGVAILENTMAYCLACIGDPASLDEALDLAERAYEEVPLPAVAGTLGAVLIQRGEPKRGLELLDRSKKAIVADGDRFETARFEVMAHGQMGDVFRARKSFRLAQSLRVGREDRLWSLLVPLGAAEAAVWLGRLDGRLPTAADLDGDGPLVARSIHAWASPDVENSVRWQHFADAGGDPSLATPERLARLMEFARSLDAASNGAPPEDTGGFARSKPVERQV